ncbi:MAG: hypothetical protein E7356_01535 [Clostridiales bacterium]|nr:hypothetical protein [Clostridiales bacterium]
MHLQNNCISFAQTSSKRYKEFSMKNTLSLSDIKNFVGGLQGQDIELRINKGRNKIVSLTAIIDKVYPSMFIISPTSDVDLDRKSYSYSDVLCGDIVFVNK